MQILAKGKTDTARISTCDKLESQQDHDEAAGLVGVLDDLRAPGADFRDRGLQLSSCIATIGGDMLEPRKAVADVAPCRCGKVDGLHAESKKPMRRGRSAAAPEIGAHGPSFTTCTAGAA